MNSGKKKNKKKVLTTPPRNCKTRGFVRTLGGRYRPLPSIHSRDSSERQRAMRQAINTVIQGTASDIMKVHELVHNVTAMIHIVWGSQ